jgi:hypothetical protein
MHNVDWLSLLKLVGVSYTLVLLWAVWIRHCRACGYWWRKKHSGLEIDRGQEEIFLVTTFTCSRCKDVEETHRRELEPDEYPAHPETYFG